MRYSDIDGARPERVRPGTFYQFTQSEWPFKVSSGLRYFARATIMRKQFTDRREVSFTPYTRVWMVVPTQTEYNPAENDTIHLRPYLVVSCPETGTELKLTFGVDVRREIRNHNDAVAYMRMLLCKEAIAVCEHDVRNLGRYPVRGHYDAAYFEQQIERLQARVDGYLTYNHYAVYEA